MCERAKRARNIFGKVYQSKNLRDNSVKTERKNRIFYSEGAKRSRGKILAEAMGGGGGGGEGVE